MAKSPATEMLEEISLIREEFNEEQLKKVHQGHYQLLTISRELSHALDTIPPIRNFGEVELESLIMMASAADQQLSQVIAVLTECRMRRRNAFKLLDRLEGLRRSLPNFNGKQKLIDAVDSSGKSRLK